METIKLDGSTLCYLHRDKEGIHLKMIKNERNKLKSGEYIEVPNKDCPTEYDWRIDISDTSYISLCKCLLAYANRNEFVNIMFNPINGSCWKKAERKTKGKKD